MSSIPITLGTVSKIRHQWDAGVFKDNDSGNAKAQQSSYNVQENPPAKYNDKLMNSIWGLYNQYAPPSFQKNYESESAVKAVTLGRWCWNQQN